MTTTKQVERALRPVVYTEVQLADTEEIKLSENLVYPWDNVASKKPRKIVLLQGIIDIFQETRNAMGCPIIVNSGYRSLEHQANLRTFNRNAVERSPHSTGAALDLDVNYIDDKWGESWIDKQKELVNHLKTAARGLGLLPWLRVGHKKYRRQGMKFVHVDIVPILFDAEDFNMKSGFDHNQHVRYMELLTTLPADFYPFGKTSPSPRNWRGGVTW